MAHSILIVDDEPTVVGVLETIANRQGYETRTAANGLEAIAKFREQPTDLVITDIRMPGMDGLALTKEVKKIDPHTQVIILTGHATLDIAVTAFKDHEAFDFLTKPQNRDDLLKVISKALEYGDLLRQNEQLMAKLHRRQTRLEDQNKKLRQTQKALEASRGRYQDLYDNAPVGYLTVNESMEVIEANQRAAELLQKELDHLLGHPFEDLIEPSSRDAYQTWCQNLMQHTSHSCEMIMGRSKSGPFTAQIEARKTTDLESGLFQTRIILTDISHRKQAEEALRKSETRFRSFVESLQGIAYQEQPDGSPIFFHGAVKAITGYSEEDFTQRRPSWTDIIHPEDRSLVDTTRERIHSEIDNILTIEYRIRHRNGKWRWLREHIQNTSVSNGTPYGVQGVIFDITGYKDLQNQIMESRRLDAIATLAGGVAHQFNNALAGLVGFLELLQMDLKKSGTTSSHVDPIFAQIERMANLTQQLLAYAKGGQYEPAKVCLADFVDVSLSLIRNRVRKEIRLETDLPTDTLWVSADTTQMQMVLLALVENAAEAIEGAARIRLATRNVEFDLEQVKDHPQRRSGRYVCLSISDEGCGMDEATLKKIFDPFFTTKFIGRGLGLSAVYGIISNHMGWLEITSQVGQGTDVRIYLPAVDPVPDKKPELKSRIADGQGATVLVIEDEAQLMRATRQRLAKLNFKPLEASTGQKAIDVLKAHKETIDVVLLDMRLPDIDGDKLYHQMLKVKPDLKIVLCSGYAIDEPVKELLQAGAHGFLQKPFSIAVLSEKLRTAIGGSGKAPE
jgi:two-component system cell cycle sensor histidine kinase/response regulator CckA